MKLVDSHSHLFLEDFQSDLPQVMMRAREAGVTHIFMPNIDSTTIEPMLKVCSEYKGYCFPMIGLHPTSVDAGYEKELAVVAGHLAMPDGYVAIGEIGMDLYWDKTYLKEQHLLFGWLRLQIRMVDRSGFGQHGSHGRVHLIEIRLGTFRARLRLLQLYR